jgi:hypothetical protein
MTSNDKMFESKQTTVVVYGKTSFTVTLKILNWPLYVPSEASLGFRRVLEKKNDLPS